MNTPTPPPSHSNSDTEDSDGEMKEEVDGTAEEELAVRLFVLWKLNAHIVLILLEQTCRAGG